MKVAVTGATGLVGSRLIEALLGRGDEVRALVRDPLRSREKLPVAAELELADLSRDLPADAFAGCDAVVHLAGESISRRWTRAWKERVRASRVEGTRRVVAAIASTSPAPRILVSGSAVGFYGDRGDERLEETSAAGEGFLAGVCQAWEAEALRAPQGVRVVLMRTAVVLDSEGGALPKILLPFRFGFGGRLGSGRQWFPWIHLADEVGLILHALDRDTVTGPLNAAAPGEVTNAELTRVVARVLRRPALLPAPAAALRLALGEMSALLLDSQRAVPRAALDGGYVFRFPEFEPALRDVSR